MFWRQKAPWWFHRPCKFIFKFRVVYIFFMTSNHQFIFNKPRIFFNESLCSDVHNDKNLAENKKYFVKKFVISLIWWIGFGGLMLWARYYSLFTENEFKTDNLRILRVTLHFLGCDTFTEITKYIEHLVPLKYQFCNK